MLSLLKRIASVKWRSYQSVLISSFTSYIRPAIDYGSELLVTASDSALSKLHIVQNKALRFIIGATTLTPITAMQLQTEISGPSEDIFTLLFLLILKPQLQPYLATIYSHQNLSLSAKNLLTHFIATEEMLLSNGSHLIVAFMEMNKSSSWPKRLQHCIHFAFRCLFETPSIFSGINFDRREFPLLQTNGCCWQILALSARWPKMCSAFFPT
ncbi:uncharacterized protein LOC103524116 [Trichonephila clavipes]|nr:uncharacterized protein LOC103524116 [Trichonephila clavipes]